MPERILAAIFLGLSCIGCARIQDSNTPAQLLQPSIPSPDSVTLEIFSVSTPWPEEPDEEALWHQVDELVLAPERRSDWARNGLRVGQIRGEVPPQFVELLQLTDQPALREEEPRAVDVNDAPIVLRRVMQLRYGHRGEVLTTGLLPTFHLLLPHAEGLRGETLHEAQGLFSIRLNESDANLIRLVATPEVRHGPPRQQIIGEQGVFRVEQGQASQILQQLQLEVDLAPAEMLLLTCRPESTGSLGHLFFRQQTAQGKQRKLLFLRIAAVPKTRLFGEEPG